MNNIKSTIDYVSEIEIVLNNLLKHSSGLEQQCFELKKVIFLLANSFAIDQDGNLVRNMSQEQADYIKKICEKHHVFGYSKSEVN